jgi:hypothetical protein
MKKTNLVMGLAFAACGLSSAHGTERLLVQVPAALDPAAPIARAVRAECGVEMLVGNHVFAQVGQRWPGAESVAGPGNAGSAKLLRVTLLSVMGTGGGAWSGSKSMTVRADLVQNGRTLQSTVLTRQSGGGVFGGMKGTCAIMERIAVTLGKDVAAWLPPSAGAPLAADAPAQPGEPTAP